ncbi:hypothetical protein HK104_011471 [Borealophlyctis nickersoniae]|nr:hypothetical protein HK104_011471 [Borealophlyctis nickersoniae]
MSDPSTPTGTAPAETTPTETTSPEETSECYPYTDPGIAWQDLYFATYVTSFLLVVLLLALFLGSIMRIKQKRVVWGFWLAVIPHVVNMINGMVSYSVTEAAGINFLNFLWSFCSAVEHWAIVYMVYVRVETTIRMNLWLQRGLLCLVALVFVFTLADQLFWTIGYISSTDAGYNTALIYLDCIWPLIMDIALYLMLAYTMHQNSKALNHTNTRGEVSLAAALLFTQLLRTVFFFGIEVAGLIYGVYPYDTPIPLVLVYNIMKPARAFLIVTDMDRVQGITGRTRSKHASEVSASVKAAAAEGATRVVGTIKVPDEEVG